MKDLFERETVDEILSRIDKLQRTSQRHPGKMDVAQMLAQCSAGMDMASGRLNPPRAFLERVLGRFVKPLYTNEKHSPAIAPAAKELAFSSPCDSLREQQKLHAKVRQFHEGGEAQCTRHPHPFFGALTPQEWGRGTYKHLDHRLRQFGV